MQQLPEQVKYAGDAISVIGWMSVLTGLLTTVTGLMAAVASLVWACIRIYETDTFQKFLKRKQP